ncbi:hypothetical protein BDV97DRAFT_358406, partial [Delphinella strobiligena]
MAALITHPDARTLLPPLLACLPTAFVSPHPPPAVLPLLSPILRQRLTLLSGNTSSGNGGWLSLLSWDAKRAKKLGKHLEGVQFEAHPVSGELELEDVRTIEFRRLDEETLQSRLHVEEFELLPVYVWVISDDQNSGTGPGWKLAELRVLEDKEDGTTWYPTPETANANAPSLQKSAPAPAAAAAAAAIPTTQAQDEADDDDDYWAAYDRTPGQTPARTPAKHSPAPTHASALRSSTHPQVGPTASELEYFSRYATEVQPALDSHDPDEETSLSNSTLQGDELTRAVNPTQNSLYAAQSPPPYTSPDHARETDIEAPRATSPSSAGSGSVERLERAAAHSETGSGAELRAEIGVRQFISTEMKSLFRLARSVGMDRVEFSEVVGRELDVLGMLEGD